MNGRAYDYNLGRFLSVDPFIQSPGNSQSMNPYSYIMNNPLSGTDPSGYKACDADGSLKGCADDIEPGETKDIEQSQTGSRIKRKVGTIGKDKDGNVYVTSGNGKEGRQAIKGAMEAMKNIESIGSQANMTQTVGTSNSSISESHADVSQERAERGTADLAAADATLDIYDEIARESKNSFAGTADSLEEARQASANKFAPVANFAYREAGWLIVQLKDGTYAYTFPVVAEAGNLNGRTLSIGYVEGWSMVSNVVEGWHNHWDSNLQHSGADASWLLVSSNSGQPLGLIDYQGNSSLLHKRKLNTYKQRNGRYRLPQQVPRNKRDRKSVV